MQNNASRQAFFMFAPFDYSFSQGQWSFTGIVAFMLIIPVVGVCIFSVFFFILSALTALSSMPTQDHEDDLGWAFSR